MHLADAFIQSDLQCIQAIHFLVSTCVLWVQKSVILSEACLYLTLSYFVHLKDCIQPNSSSRFNKV